MKFLVLAAAIVLTGTIATCDVAADGLGETEVVNAAADAGRADSIARVRLDSINRARPDYVIDSILPVEEEIRRFSAKVGGAPATGLAHASDSRDALIRRIVRDVASSDSIDLIRTAVSPREFLDLVYPPSRYTRAPYRQSPELVWLSIAMHSVTGYRRLLGRLAGQPLRLVDYTCSPRPQTEGENIFWNDCTLRLTNGSDTSVQRWFGSIIERDGRFKVMSFSNQF